MPWDAYFGYEQDRQTLRQCVEVLLKQPRLAELLGEYSQFPEGEIMTSARARQRCDEVLKDLDRCVGGAGSLSVEVPVLLSHHRNQFVTAVVDIDQYPAELRDEANRKFPRRALRMAYSAPDGFERLGGIKGWFARFRSTGSVKDVFRRPGQRLPEILVHAPKASRYKHPWQIAYDFGARAAVDGFKQLASRYLSVGGTSGVLIAYETPRAICIEANLISERELVLILGRTEEYEQLRVAFDQFMGSIA